MTDSNLAMKLAYATSRFAGKNRSEYKLKLQDSSYYGQSNGLNYEITPDGETRIQHDLTDWRLRLSHFGRKGQITTVDNVTNWQQPSNNELSCEGDSVTLWWTNGPRGLQQGWNIHEKPVGIGFLELIFEQNRELEILNNGLLINKMLRYTGLLAFDSKGKDLASSFELYKDGFKIIVDDTDAVYPITVDPFVDTTTPTSTLSAGGSSVLLGFSVSLSDDGSTALVGDPFANGNFGIAYIFERPITGWTPTSNPVAALSNSNGTNIDFLGFSVSISANGSTALVGGRDVNGSLAGAAYIFERPVTGIWIDNATPDAILNPTVSSDVGFSVSISADGSIALIGAPAFNVNRGAAYIFEKPVTGWESSNTATAILTNLNGVIGDRLGSSVSISADGSTALTGAQQANTNRGAAYVFEKSITGWENNSDPAVLNVQGASIGDLFGISVSISGNGSTALIGAYGVNATRGAAYIFEKPVTGWEDDSTPTATLDIQGASINDQFGISVSISADSSTVLIGAFRANGGIGASYIFYKNGVTWNNSSTPSATLTNSAPGTNDFGYSGSISPDGSTAIIGTDSTNSAYIYVASQATTITTLDVKPISAGIGEMFTATVTVTSTTGGIPPIFGNIIISDGATVIGIGTLIPSGSSSAATISFSFNTAGSRTISATYEGNGNYSTSISNNVMINVTGGGPQASLTLSKKAEPLTFSQIGDVITYTYIIKNTGNITVDNITLIDDVIGEIPCPNTTLTPGTSATCIKNYSVTAVDLKIGSITNKATVTGDNAGTQVVAEDSFTVNLKCLPLVISSTTLPPAIIGIKYRQQLELSNAVPPVTWKVIEGSLPRGLSLNIRTGEISGTPTTAGEYKFTVRAEDSSACTTHNNISTAAITTKEFIIKVIGKKVCKETETIIAIGVYDWTIASSNHRIHLEL